METNQVRCGQCWWFAKYPPITKSKGHCLMYGFEMHEDDVICCDFAYGKR